MAKTGYKTPKAQRAACQRYYAANKEKIAAYYKNRYADPVNREAQNQRTQAWRKEMLLLGVIDMRHDMVNAAKQRARKRGLPFHLSVEDIIIPSHCPVLGIPLERKLKSHGPGLYSPTLDKIIPERGYVRGNVWIISHRANLLKSNGTLEEMRKIVRCLELIEEHRLKSL